MSKEMIVKLNSDRVKLNGCEYVQDLVRCKECRHHEDFPTGISPITCSFSWGGVFENDFCSYGEKMERK